MKTTDFDALATSAPVNRDAAVARDGSGDNYEPKVTQPARLHWDAPPRLMPLPKEAENLAGRKMGRLTVIGYFGSHHKDRGSRWVVRCLCGGYEVRTSKAIRNPANKLDCCWKCHHLADIQKSVEFLRTGKNQETAKYLRL